MGAWRAKWNQTCGKSDIACFSCGLSTFGAGTGLYKPVQAPTRNLWEYWWTIQSKIILAMQWQWGIWWWIDYTCHYHILLLRTPTVPQLSAVYYALHCRYVRIYHGRFFPDLLSTFWTFSLHFCTFHQFGWWHACDVWLMNYLKLYSIKNNSKIAQKESGKLMDMSKFTCL